MTPQPPSVLIAPDKFKGCLTSAQVAEALRRGVLAAAPSAVVDVLPLADGGDGSVDAALCAGYRPVPIDLTGTGAPTARATLAASADTVIVEVANTCGLSRYARAGRQPMLASSAGLGAAVRAAVDLAPRRIVVALGGSASTDGGLGLLAALGGLDVHAYGRAPGGADLARVEDLAVHGLLPPQIDLVFATDVTNPLLGATGAAAVFGPQKGATPEQVTELEGGLAHLVSVAAKSRPEAAALAAAPGAGAAGGLGFAGLLLGGRIVSGADFFLDLLGFDDAVAGRDLVITGEGSFDEQSLSGKLPSVVARRSPVLVDVVAGRSSVPVPALAGLGFGAVHTLAERSSTATQDDPALSAALLCDIGQQLGARLVDRSVCSPT